MFHLFNFTIKKNANQERIETIQEEIDEQNASLHIKTKQLNDIKHNIESFHNNIEMSGSQITENDRQTDALRVKIGDLELNKIVTINNHKQK